jgi:hypothetical protein
LESDHRSRVFAISPTRYFELYPVEESPLDEIEGEVVEFDPEDEREMRLMMNEMKRAGIKFAE